MDNEHSELSLSLTKKLFTKEKKIGGILFTLFTIIYICI